MSYLFGGHVARYVPCSSWQRACSDARLSHLLRGPQSSATPSMPGPISGFMNAMESGIHAVGSGIQSTGQAVGNAVESGVNAVESGIKSTGNAVGATGRVMSSAAGSVKSATEKLTPRSRDSDSDEDSLDEYTDNSDDDEEHHRAAGMRRRTAPTTTAPGKSADDESALFTSRPTDVEVAETHEELRDRYLQRANDHTTIEAIEKAGRDLDNAMGRLLGGVKHSTIDRVLKGVGKSVHRSVVIEGAPQAFTDTAKKFARKLWQAMRPKLRASMVGPVQGDYAAYLIRNWARRYPYYYAPDGGQPRPRTWARARVLYALYPADKTIFQKLRQLPLYCILMALKLDPVRAPRRGAPLTQRQPHHRTPVQHSSGLTVACIAHSSSPWHVCLA